MVFDRPLLSILIASLESRHYLLNRLYGRLREQRSQLSFEEMIQIVVLRDAGETSIGVKRNALMAAAHGTLVAFVDDDDDVSDDYIAHIVELSIKKPDVIQLNGEIRTDGGPPKLFHHSIVYPEWTETDQAYFRPPGHLNPIRRDIASQFLFPVVRAGEDYQWSLAVQRSKLLRKEAKTDNILYKYHFTSRKKDQYAE